MFKEFANFKYKRNLLQAIGFYVVYLVIVNLFTFLFCVPVVIGASNELGIEESMVTNIGSIVGWCNVTVAGSLVSFLIIVAKKIYTSPLAIIFFILTVIGNIFASGLVGFIFPAILSTFNAKD